MKAFEVKKGEADIKHGMVMMAIEGKEAVVRLADKILRTDFNSCEYVEEAKKKERSPSFS